MCAAESSFLFLLRSFGGDRTPSCAIANRFGRQRVLQYTAHETKPPSTSGR